MRVRVYDKDKNTYFKSELYGIINIGWYSRYLVLVPDNGKYYLKFYDYLDKSQSGPIYPVNINIITYDTTADWIVKKDVSLQQITHLLANKDIKFDYFRGFEWLFQESELMADLIAGKIVTYEATPVKARNVSSFIEGWHYIESQTDIGLLFDAFCGFHDSCITRLSYVSGAEVFEDHSMKPIDDIRQVTMHFDSQNSQSVEMVFEGVLALNLRPAPDGYSSEIVAASLILEDETIFFCGDDIKSEQQLSYEGTWIKAFGLRWRQLD